MPQLKELVNPTTGQKVKAATDYLSPNTLSQYSGMTTPTPAPIAAPVSTQPTPAPIPTPGRSMYRGAEYANLANTPEPVIEPETGQEPPKKTPVFATQSTPNMQRPLGGVSDHGLGQAYKKEQEALGKVADAQAEKSLAEGKVYEEARQQMQEIETNKSEMRQEYQKEFAEYEQKISDLSAQAAGEVDPRRYWKNKSAFGKIGAALSVMAGAIGTGLQGGRGTGPAMDIIMRQIDQDIEAQRVNLANKGREAQMQTNLYKMALDKFGNEQAAMDASRIALIDQTKMRLGEMTANSNSEIVRNQGAQAQAQLDQKRAESKIRLDQYAQQQAARQAQGMDRFIPGVGYSFDKESAKETRKFTSTYGTIKSQLGKLMSLRKKYGAKKAPGSVKSEMNALSTQLITLANQAVFELGALSKDDVKILKEAIPGGTDFGFAMAKYKSFDDLLDERAQNFYKTRIINFQGLPEKDERFTPKDA